MGRYHQEKTKTGKEYVESTRKFVAVTYERCMRLPDRWNDFLLRPLILKAQEIESLVVRANAIYINESVWEANKSVWEKEKR